MPTLEELNETLRFYKESIVFTKEEIAIQQRKEEYLKQSNEVFSIYSAFVAAGFTEEQAWELLITFIKNKQ